MSLRGSWSRGRGRSSRRSRREGLALANQGQGSGEISTQPFGLNIDRIDAKALLIEETTPRIENARYVASYNWVDGTDPVILVPGSPPAWTPPKEPTKLEPDSQDVFRDINAAKYHAYPIEPSIRAILALEPKYDLQTVDIIGCGSTLGNLMRFASQTESKPFRFDADLIGDTLFFVRRGSSPTELIKDLRGYGHTFPERFTTWDAEVGRSSSHQRIIQYDFGGLRFLVRSETDAYVQDAATPSTNDSSGNEGPLIKPSLPDVFNTISISLTYPSSDGQLRMNLQGKKVPQQSIFDIKTRSEFNVFDMNEILPRLWLNQTPNFLLAYHRYGLFEPPLVKDIAPNIIIWERNNSMLLGRFSALIKRIVNVVQDSDNQQVEISWDGQGLLRITNQIGDSRRALPPDMRGLWESI